MISIAAAGSRRDDPRDRVARRVDRAEAGELRHDRSGCADDPQRHSTRSRASLGADDDAEQVGPVVASIALPPSSSSSPSGGRPSRR
jgi:hypothetical protein